MAISPKTVFIIWNEYNRRPDILSQALKCEKIFVKRIISNRTIFWKFLFWIDYLYKAVFTTIYLIYKNPDLVFAQSPPSFCPMVCWFYCKITKRTLVVDGHNNAFEPPWISVPLYKKVMERSKFVLVHNEELSQSLSKKYISINFYILPDRIFHISPMNIKNPDTNGKYFLIIASFAGDEPLIELLEGIILFLNETEEDIEFKITGNYKRKIKIYDAYNEIKGIKFLGYIDDDRYFTYFNNAYGIIALTTRPMVQQCAAIEAIGAQVPIITSDNTTNRRIFFKGAVLTNNYRNEIKDAINKFILTNSSLRMEMDELKVYHEQEWEKRFSGFLAALG